MSKLEFHLEKIRMEYSLKEEDFWPLPMKKDTWLIKHKALEIVAAKAGIVFDPPMIVEANAMDKVATIVVTGHLEKRTDWSFGEAAPTNNKNSYPFAMAEKRAKDRVVLKLVGLHGYLYSEDEADDFKESNPENNPQAYETKKDGTLKNAKGYTGGKMNSAGKRATLDDIVADLGDVHSNNQLNDLYRAWAKTINAWTESDDEVEVSWKSVAMDLFTAKRKELNDVRV